MDWKRLNTTPAIWGSDSELFRPERFASMSPMSYRYAFLRFGFGRERCLGKNIAEIMLKLVLISIVQQYDMKPGKNDGIRQDKFTVTSDGEIGFTPIVHAWRKKDRYRTLWAYNIHGTAKKPPNLASLIVKPFFIGIFLNFLEIDQLLVVE